MTVGQFIALSAVVLVIVPLVMVLIIAHLKEKESDPSVAETYELSNKTVFDQIQQYPAAADDYADAVEEGGFPPAA